MNKTLAAFTRSTLKANLALCTEDQQMIFKRMYSHRNLELSIDEVVEQMSDDKLDWAMSQVERTLDGNSKEEK